MLSSYKELVVWNRSIQLVKEIYLLTEHFPKDELYALTSQMKRSAISIPSNIAEGYGRKTTKEYIQFCTIAYGSGLELETQLIIAKDLEFANQKMFQKSEDFLVEVLKMLNVLILKLKTKH